MAAGPYGHPFHPILIPLPIGAWIASLVFDLATYWAGEPLAFVRGAYWLIIIGIAAALLASVFGFMDLLRVPIGTKAFKIGVTHMSLNVTVVALYLVGLALRQGRLDEAPVALAPLAVSVVALTGLALSGWLGGELTYRYGVRVAEESTQADAYWHK